MLPAKLEVLETTTGAAPWPSRSGSCGAGLRPPPLKGYRLLHVFPVIVGCSTKRHCHVHQRELLALPLKCKVARIQVPNKEPTAQRSAIFKEWLLVKCFFVCLFVLFHTSAFIWLSQLPGV